MSQRQADLREWIARIEELGELQHVTGAHWDLEIGTISEINYRRKPPAALLFDDIVGYPRGYRVLTGSMSNARRMAVTLGLDPNLDTASLVQALRGKPLAVGGRRAAVRAGGRRVGSDSRERRPGRDVDLTRFPAPRWHEHDGGRYIGTGVAVVTSDPDTGRINVGAYRMMIQEDGRSATINAEAGKQGRAQYDRWFAKHGKAPVLASFGHDPLLLMVAGTEVPNTISEYAYAGAMVGQRIPVSAARSPGLPMPAAAEIVVEGWMRPDRVLARRAVRGVDGLLLGLAAPGARAGDRAPVLPERPDHPRHAAREAAERLLVHARAAEVGHDSGRAREGRRP